MKKIITSLFIFMFLPAVAQTNLIQNGDFSQWENGSPLPVGFILGTNDVNTANYFSKSTETYNGLNAIKMTFRNSSSGSSRYFSANPVFLEKGDYLLTFYLKGSGWLRTVNLTRGTEPTNSANVSDINIPVRVMGTSFTATTLNEWQKYQAEYTVPENDNYCLTFAHNNVVSGNVLNIANISLVQDEFPKNTQLESISVAGNLLNGFSPEKQLYYYKLPYETGDTGFPDVTYVAQEGSAVSVTNATNLSGTEKERTVTLTVTRSERSIVYQIIFYRGGGANDARMETIEFDGIGVDNFSMDTYIYHQYIPYNTAQVPVLTGNVLGTGNYNVTPASSLTGTEVQRTAIVTCTSGDGSMTLQYKITFEVLPKLDLYLCIGQSNMAGRGVMVPGLGDLDPIDKAWLFTTTSNWEVASNPLNKYSEVRKQLDIQQINPAYSFVKKIIAETGHHVGLIVNARGGTAIEAWLKGNSSGYYASSIRRALEAKKWGEFKGILWHQGEGNSQLDAIPKYPAQLSAMVADYRKDLESENIFFCAGQLAQWYPDASKAERMTLFNAMLDTISSFISYSSRAESDGLTPINDDYDDPHFDRESQFILGERYADEVLRYVYDMDTATKSSDQAKIDITVVKKGNNVHILNKTGFVQKGSLVDVSGKIIKRFTFGESIEIPGLSQGMYIVSVDGNNIKFAF